MTRASPNLHQPTLLGRAESKNLSFHVAHVVHRPSQTWAVSLLGRTITIHRIGQASFRTFPYVSGRLISPALHSTVSYFALGLYHLTLPHLHRARHLRACCRAPSYDSVKSRFGHRSPHHRHRAGLSLAEPHSPSLFIISLSLLLASLI